MPTVKSAKPRCYMYSRYSHTVQAEGMSLERQADAAERWATANGYELDDRYSFTDQGVPASRGANLERGAFSKFRKAVAAGDVPTGSILLIESVSRFSRLRPGHSRPILQELCDAGLTVIFLDTGMKYDADSIDTLAADVTFTVLSHGAAEKAAELSRFRTLAWEKARREAREGKTATRTLPWWLHVPVTLDAEGRTIRGKIERVSERVDVVKRIFSEYLSGLGRAEIAAGLGRDGIPTPDGAGKRKAAFWREGLIYRTLTNRAVLGEWAPHREVKGRLTRKGGIAAALKRTRVAEGEVIRGYFPVVIPLEVFEQAQAVLASNRAKAGGRTNPGRGEIRHFLARLATCPLCGSAMLRANKGRADQAKYVCSKARQHAGTCERVYVPVALVETALRANADMLAASAPLSDPALADELAGVEQLLSDASLDCSNLQEDIAGMLARGERVSSAVNKMMAEHEAKADELQARYDALKARAVRASTNVVRALVERLRFSLQNCDGAAFGASVADVAGAMYAAFERVVIDWKAGELVLHWRHGIPPTTIRYVDDRAGDFEMIGSLDVPAIKEKATRPGSKRKTMAAKRGRRASKARAKK